MAVSFQLTARPTDEDIVELSRRNPGLQIERRASGELVLTPTGFEAARRELELGAQLHRWTATDGRGIAFGASAGFRLPDGSLLCPDASWVRRERCEALTLAQREGFAPLSPDAVFEIRAQSDSLGELRAKMRVYAGNGVPLAVLIDPQRRAVEIYTSDRTPQVLETAESVSFDFPLQGFTLDLRRVFE